MTDARFPERWLNDRRVVRLNDVAFRTFVTTLAWSVANRTDGVIELEDIDIIHGAHPAAIPSLVRCGLWSEVEAGVFLSTVFHGTQSSRHELEVLDNLRRREREKKARQRAKPGPDDVSPGTSPGTASPGTVPGDCIGQDRQDRQEGKAGTENAWPAVRLVDSDTVDEVDEVDDDDLTAALAEHRGAR